MQLRKTILKNIRITLILLISSLSTLYAQKQKIDGVAVVIGKNIVLRSDITKFKNEVEQRSEGKMKISDCEMLEELMKQKLLSHHAVIDSVAVTKSDIDNRVNRSIDFFTKQYGSIDKVVAVYGFNDEKDLRKELAKVQKENVLIEKEQQKITEKVAITPEEIRVYFNGLKAKNELPEFPAEVELAQIVLNAESTKEENDKVIAKLKKLKKEIEEGASFSLKAIINSEDPSATQNSGNLGVIKKESPFIKEFKEVAFSLDEGQISEPFKTIFGYHIIKLHKIKGEGREVSHILMQPEVSDEKLKETKEQVEKIKKEIEEGKITFSEAVKKYSEDKDTKNNDGLIINPYTQETLFDLTRMQPELYGRINDLKQGELSDVYYDETRGGEKMYKIIFIRKRTDTHTADLVDDYVKIQKLALLKKKEESIKKWTKGKIQETYIKLGDDFKNCSFKFNWKKDNE